MRSVLYQLASTSVLATNPAAAQLPIIRPATIIGIAFRYQYVAGAGAGYVRMSANLNNLGVNYELTNNPPRESILASGAFVLSAGGAGALGPTPVVPCNCPVRIGDTVSIGLYVSGTAPTSLEVIAEIVCLEA